MLRKYFQRPGRSEKTSDERSGSAGDFAGSSDANDFGANEKRSEGDQRVKNFKFFSRQNSFSHIFSNFQFIYSILLKTSFESGNCAKDRKVDGSRSRSDAIEREN